VTIEQLSRENVVRNPQPIARIGAPLLLAIIVLCAYSIVLEHVDRRWGWADYIGHYRAAADWWQGKGPRTPHFLFEALTILCRTLFGARTFRSAAIMAVEVSAVAAALATYAFWTRLLPARNDRDCWVAALWCLGLQVAGPITLATIWTKSLYLGYIYPASTYHNPTILILKPLALLSFALGLAALERAIVARVGWKLVLAASAAGVLSALAKPSWLLCFLPGLALAVVLDSRLRSRRPAWELVAAVLFTGLCVLAWQYAFLYGNSGADRVIFTPEKWLSKYGSLAPVKLILSIAYPLSVLVVFWNEVRTSLLLRLAWATFVLSLLVAYCFSEEGPRALHDNLGWSAQIALFVLFVASTIAMVGTLRQEAPAPLVRVIRFRIALPVALFALHVAGGVTWYATYFTGQGNWGWY
jgi:hypothetical protein